MRIDVYLPLLLSLMLAVSSPVAARYLAPASAARALAVTGVVTALASVWALLLLAGTLIDDTPPVAAEARENGIRIPEPVPEIIAVTAILALALGAYRVHRVIRAHRASRRALVRLREAHDADTELIVAASGTPEAFALPGTPGRILVTSAMFGGLNSQERHVLLAHERAHLRHRHDRLRLLVDMAAAANPLLIPVRDAVAFLLERWADEQAADTVADRSVAARALARAALLSHHSRLGAALRFSGLAVTRRVAALQSAPPSPTRFWAAVVLALALIPAVAAADATADWYQLLSHTLSG